MSIYIHIPFCNSICTYCDFCKILYDRKYINDYLDNQNMSQKLCDAKKQYMQHHYHLASKMLDLPLLATH